MLIDLKLVNLGPTAAPGDFIALGKQSKPNEGEVKRPTSPQHLGRKKESPGSTASSTNLAKKPKLSTSAFGSLGRPHGDTASSSSSSATQFDEIAITGKCLLL